MTYREVPIGEAQREMIDDRVVILLPTPMMSWLAADNYLELRRHRHQPMGIQEA